VAIYLGLDLSTQSLTAIAIEVDGARRRVVFQHAFEFDTELPHYGTRHGVLPHNDPLVATSSPLMWAEALDRMMGIIAAESGLDLSRIRAISGSAQQHGSVYLDAAASATLASLDPAHPLVHQLAAMLSRRDAPIWMDASTAAQCAAITREVGGGEALARLTGSRAFERFTGPQIRKYAECDPEGYARTDRIHLVSSFLASLLAGRHAPIEPGDGSGMNLMDIARREWAPAALAVTAPDLRRRLPPVEPSWTVVAPLARYWTGRYGFPPARVVAWSGDNPCSSIGTGIVREGQIAVSLGTSDTLFGLLREPRVDPSGTGHLFGAPTGDYLSLVCCRNGSLARERVRKDYGLDWAGFSHCLEATSPGNGGAIMLPWFEPEITPTVLTPGVRRYGLDAADGPANVRAVVEAQMLALALHSRWIGVDVDTIYATGGAARNRDILQVMADVHGADVYQLEVGNSACLGAALRAYHADRVADGRPIAWEEVVAGFAEPVVATRIRPVPAHVAVYAKLARVYEACEAHALGRGGDPADRIAGFRGWVAGGSRESRA
jgi:xylulokinase